MNPQKDSQPAPKDSEDSGQDKPAPEGQQAEDTSLIDESKAESLPPAKTPQVGATISPQSQPSADTEPVASTSSAAGGTAPASDGRPASTLEPRTTAAQPSAATPPIKHPKKKKRWVVALIIMLAVLLAGGGAALAYFAYYLPNRPNNVLKAALANSFGPADIESVSFAGEFSLSGEDKDGFIPSGGSFEGTSSQDGRFDISVDIDALVATITVDMRSADGKSMYIRAGGLAGLPELLASSDEQAAQIYASLLEGIDNQWFEVNESLIKQFTDGSLTPDNAELQKIADLYVEHPFLAVHEALPDEEVDSTESYHYRVVVDKQQLLAFAAAVKDADVQGFTVTDDQLQSVKDAVKDVNFADYPVEVWIAKDGKRFTKLAFTMTEGDVTFDMELRFTGYNEPVEVEQPEDAKSILELLGGFFGGLGESSLTPGATPGLDLEEGLPPGISL